MQPSISLSRRLLSMAKNQPGSWTVAGRDSRPGLHGLIRYPAMMVPSMQGDILDAIIAHSGSDCLVLDPFVGSGTTMTEALTRGLDFTGVDINPLAILVCEAKAAVDAGTDVAPYFSSLYKALTADAEQSIDVDFVGREKWFSEVAAMNLSRIRRAIQRVPEQGVRKLLWVVLADTIRLSSNSRTSTYKLHVRADGATPDPSKVIPLFIAGAKLLMERAAEYRSKLEDRRRSPKVKLICGDIRSVRLASSRTRANIVVTSPPYGDNQTTIPYGQYSYLALNWIDPMDLSQAAVEAAVRNANSLDSSSLGGRVANAKNAEEVLEISSGLRGFMKTAKAAGKDREVRKVLSFMQDYLAALKKIQPSTVGGTYWIFTTGNRRAAGLLVPFDRINEDIAEHFGGRVISSIQRNLPVKRMPSKNSQGQMITTETTMIAEFGV